MNEARGHRLTLREDCRLELSKLSHDFSGQATLCWSECVLKHHASVKTTLNDSKKLSCTRVDVRGVHAAWLEESNCTGNAKISKSWEVFLVGNQDASTGGICLWSSVEVEYDSVLDLRL